MNIQRVDTQRCALGEGALWSADEEALYYLDIFGQRIFRHDPAGSTKSWSTPGRAGAMALRERGGVVVAVETSFYALDLLSGVAETIAGPVFDGSHLTVNDGATDRCGRFLFGSCSTPLENPQPVGGLFSLDADHCVSELDSGIHQSNSHCFSPDGCTLYCADSFVHTVFAYDYGPETGRVANKRAFANTSELGGVPDGSAVDTDGVVWVSIFQGGKVVAFRPDGDIERIIEMPVQLISSVAWGGPGLNQLYVTTIDPTQFGWPAQDGSGYVYVVDGLGSRGIPEPYYRG